jgi:iron complex outermembrane receptor protein
MLKVLEKRGAGFAALLISSVGAAVEVPFNGPGATGDDSVQLAEVVVTAQKRTESVQDVPAAVSVLGGADLDKLQAIDLVDYSSYVAGLQVDSGGTPGQTQITLRGVDANGGGVTVGTYIDDTPLGSSSLFAQGASYQLDLMPYDLERVEVLKGPQGTLYGASTMGGLVKYVLRSPDTTSFEAHAGVDLFDIDSAGAIGRGARASVNLPVIEDTFAVRLSYFNRFNPGYINNGATGVPDQNTDRQQGGRLAALWKVSSNLSIKLTAMLQNINADAPSVMTVNTVPLRVNASGQPIGFVPGAPVYGDLSDSHIPTLAYDQRLKFFSATLNWDLGWADLTSASSYSEALNNINFDLTTSYGFGALIPILTNGAVAQGLTPFNTKLNLYKTTQEVRLASPTGRELEWLLGLFLTKENAPQIQNVAATTLDLAPIPGINPLARFDSPSRYSEVSGFGDLTVKLPWNSDITGGLRYARDHQFAGSDQTGVIIPNSDAGSGASEVVHTYMGALRHHFDNDMMAYARVASGFRPGGPNTPFPGVPARVDPDTLVNYELGFKGSLWDRKLQLDIAAFHINWSDVQVEAQTIEGIQYETNGGSAKSNGVEVESILLPVRGLNIRLNGAYTDAVLTSAVPALGYQAGDRLALTPRFSASAVADYVTNAVGGWRADCNAAYRYVGERFSLVNSDPNTLRLAAYGALDISAGMFNSRYTVRLFAKNVTNKRAYLSETVLSSPDSGTADVTILQPLTFGVSLDVAF